MLSRSSSALWWLQGTSAKSTYTGVRQAPQQRPQSTSNPSKEFSYRSRELTGWLATTNVGPAMPCSIWKHFG